MNPEEVFKIENLTKRILELEAELQEEKEKVEKLKNALVFYSDSKQWHGENKYYTSLDSDAEKKTANGCGYFVGGKLARQTLLEIKEMEG